MKNKRAQIIETPIVARDDLLLSIKSGEFEPYIQPIIRASDLNIIGGELLVRWHTPSGEIIQPVHFIRQIESACLLSDMTCNLMLQAVNELSEIKDILPEDFRLAVNVTPGMLDDRKFIQMCMNLSGKGNIRLVLELTEKQPFYTNWQTEWVLNLLSNAGLELSLDDFGTGYSMLLYLKHYPISYIKMDKSFTQDILKEDISKHIMESVVGLAERLSINIVAEGVETREQVTFLRHLKVNYLQGFYFCKPEKLTTFCCKYRHQQMCYSEQF